MGDASTARVPTNGSARAGKPLSVGVLVDLFWEPTAGGHVKCWERFAEAATSDPSLDLTIYFLGESRRVVHVSRNVRYKTIRPFVPTHWFRFLDGMPDHTDIAWLHPELIEPLRRHHVLHTTSAFFSLARTALLSARVSGRPLVNSIHTDTPSYTRVYSAQAIPRLLGNGLLGRLLKDRWHMHERLAAMMERRLQRYLQRCDWALGSNAEDMYSLKVSLPEGRFSILRRGIDKQAFHPGKRDRARMERAFGIPQGRFVAFYVGRLDPDKSALTVAQAARILRDRGQPLTVIFVGEGTQKDEIRTLLGDDAVLPGSIQQSELGWLYASADLFVFPSRHEISPNVVVEAKASGLPVMVSSEGGSSQFILRPGEDGIVIEENSAAAWAAATDVLWKDAKRRRGVGEKARQSIDAHWLSWRDVLQEDLVPIWQRVASEKGLWKD